MSDKIDKAKILQFNLPQKKKKGKVTEGIRAFADLFDEKEMDLSSCTLIVDDKVYYLTNIVGEDTYSAMLLDLSNAMHKISLAIYEANNPEIEDPDPSKAS